MSRVSSFAFVISLAVFVSIWSMCGESQAYNRYAHVELFNKSVDYLQDCGLNDVYEFYTGNNPDSIDIRDLADQEDEIMWVDVHSTTEPDEDAAQFLINRSYAYCWNDSLEKLQDPGDIESCKDCIRAVVDQFPGIALPRAGQETVYFPSRGTLRSRYDFFWEVPLSLIVGLVDPLCDSLGTRYGVLAENSLRTKVQVHDAKFKSMEYLNYAIRTWNDSECESSLRWLTRICNYDPHHTSTVFKSYDYLTEDWVSQDMDGDLDIDYDDAEIWNQNLLNYGIYYVLFCNLADPRMPAVPAGSIGVHQENLLDWHSTLMNERASYSATLWPLVDELNDYFNGNAESAVDTLLPKIVKATALLLAQFYYSVIDSAHPEFVVVDVEGIPRTKRVPIHYWHNYSHLALIDTDSLSGEHFKYYDISNSFGMEVEECVGCDTTMGYRFSHMIVSDGDTTYNLVEPTLTVDRATTVHLVYTPHWNVVDEFEADSEPQQHQQFSSHNRGTPEVFSLSQNYPNPVSKSTIIRYALPRDCYVKLEVYNTAGQKVMVLVDEKQQAGYRSADLDAEMLPAGIYFYRLYAGNYRVSKGMIVVK